MKEKIKKFLDWIKLYFNKDKIEDRLIREKIKNWICPITNEKIENNIYIYNFNHHYFWIKIQKLDVPVSNKWREIQNKNTWTFWQIFYIVSWNLSKIPIFWWIIIYIYLILAWFFLIPLWIFLDIILRKKIYWDGLIKLKTNWTIYMN